MGTMTDRHAAQHLLYLLPALLLRHAQISQRQLHILLHIQLVDQVKALEHKAYLTLTNLRALAFLQLAHFHTIEIVSAAGGIVEQAKDIQQG